jgi:hypothetical protein
MALINGIEAGWSSIKLNILGASPNGVTAISYEEKQEKKDNYGAGDKPVSRGYGNKEYTAAVTLTSKEVDAIQEKLQKGQSLTDIEPFDIQVVYQAKGSTKFVRHTLLACEFQNNGRDVKQGDTVIEVKLDLVIADINWNA